MITCPCNVYPLTPHFYIVKLGFTRVYIIFALKQGTSHLLWLYRWFAWDLVGNPEDRFSHNEAQVWTVFSWLGANYFIVALPEPSI